MCSIQGSAIVLGNGATHRGLPGTEKEVVPMRRIMLVVTVALVMAAMVGVGALPVASQGDGAEIFGTSCHIT